SAEALCTTRRFTENSWVSVANLHADRLGALQLPPIGVAPVPGEGIRLVDRRPRVECVEPTMLSHWAGLHDDWRKALDNSLPGDCDLQLNVIETGGQFTPADRYMQRLRGCAAGDTIALIVQAEWRPRDSDHLAERLVLALDDRAAALTGIVKWLVA